jgi:rubredoxin
VGKKLMAQWECDRCGWFIMMEAWADDLGMNGWRSKIPKGWEGGDQYDDMLLCPACAAQFREFMKGKKVV